jgi:hypothetical protein
VGLALLAAFLRCSTVAWRCLRSDARRGMAVGFERIILGMYAWW